MASEINIPKKVAILGRVFTVKIVPSVEIEKETQMSGAVGGVSYTKKKILVSSDLPKEDQVVTFLHECHHAISYVVGYNQIMSNELFEIAAESFANGFYDVFKSMVKK